jgi:hypothetical protein
MLSSDLETRRESEGIPGPITNSCIDARPYSHILPKVQLGYYKSTGKLLDSQSLPGVARIEERNDEIRSRTG